DQHVPVSDVKATARSRRYARRRIEGRWGFRPIPPVREVRGKARVSDPPSGGVSRPVPERV
ncbi:MAG: hypothetical protein ACE5HT_17435, partial [Gemmatimonadales bacterium]